MGHLAPWVVIVVRSVVGEWRQVFLFSFSWFTSLQPRCRFKVSYNPFKRLVFADVIHQREC